MEGFIAIVVKDNWHLGNGQHFGDLVYNYDSTSKVFPTRMEAIKNAYEVLQKYYKNVIPVGELQPKYDNELDYLGREFHIYSFELHS